MILQEKIKEKAKGYGQLAPAFLEGAEFALNEQWISVKDDLPCNHEELINDGTKPDAYYRKTDFVVVRKDCCYPYAIDRMTCIEGEGWEWEDDSDNTHWFPFPQLQLPE